jgi:hypothetical protein
MEKGNYVRDGVGIDGTLRELSKENLRELYVLTDLSM